MTDEQFMEFRKHLKAHLAEMSEEERKFNAEFTELINAYEQRYDEGIPFQMPITYEELKEAMEQDKPFHTWEKYKGWYNMKHVPPDIDL
jgi:hypothetical protein